MFAACLIVVISTFVGNVAAVAADVSGARFVLGIQLMWASRKASFRGSGRSKLLARSGF